LESLEKLQGYLLIRSSEIENTKNKMRMSLLANNTKDKTKFQSNTTSTIRASKHKFTSFTLAQIKLKNLKLIRL